MNYKFISMDLDGTIFKHDQTFTKETIECFKRLKQAGYILILNSGRIVESLKKVLERFEITQYFDYLLGANGSEFYNIHTKEFQLLSSLSPETIRSIHLDYQNEDIALCLYDDVYFLTNKITDFYAERSKLLKLNTKLVDFQNIEKSYSKVLGIIDPEKRDYFLNKINTIEIPGIDSFFSNVHLIEFVGKGVSKLSGIDYILGLYDNLYAREQVLSFGDSENDKEMLKYTTGVRMGENNPILNTSSRYFTASVDENGFSNFIYKHLLNSNE